MDDLLIKYLMGEATPGEATQVEQWISADAGNRKRYEQLKATWEISAHNTLPVVPDAQQALQRLKRKLEAAGGTGVTGKQTGSPASVPGSTYRFMRSWRVAAIFIGIACTGAIVYSIIHQKKDVVPVISDKTAQPVKPTITAPVAVTIQTDMAGNSVMQDTLPDGSIVTLNKHAAVSYPVGLIGDTRTVELTGDAFFSVAHNPSRPFIVHVNGITVRVVGTSFNISGNTERTEVNVKTGIVQVTTGVDSLKLYAGDQMVVLKSGKYTTINKRSTQQQEPVKKDLPGIDTQGKKHGKGPDMAVIEAQKQSARNIIADMTRLKIIVDKDHLSWFALDNRVFVVDGKAIADSIHKIFKEKYIKPIGMGYYYGPNQVRGSGLCFDKSDLY